MQETDFDWNRSYVMPASLRFRPTPSGGLQVDGGAGEPTIEVPRDQATLVLAFARSQTAEAAYQSATEEWEVDRDSFRMLLGTWIANGLLEISDTGGQAPSRLALFTQATAAEASRRLPLRSHFPLQRPLEFYPGLETREIHDSERFPWVAALEGSFPLIREEFARLVQAGSGFSTVYRSQTSTGEWAASYLWVFGKKVEDTCRSCPQTADLLGAIPGVAEFGTTLYSGLAPHTHIAPHFGYTNAKLRCQLPLQVPGRCKLKVGDHEVEQREGKCIVFDDSFLHSAWNDSDEPRFVLVFDFFHPDLTPGEIQYLIRLAKERQLATALLDQAAAAKSVDWVGAEATG
jgi:aspartyl/asparaginyl beta-hydroxylase (cupin superfamily)